tara:strand:- start:62 stop:985 length:924 start_codon:yes stop_codon:yes gene_type:complete
MKKILCIIVLILFYSTIAKAQSYKLNDIVENNFIISKKFVLNLPIGKWVVAEKSSEYYYGIRTKIYFLLKIENKKAVEAIEIGEVHTGSIAQPYVNQAIYEALFKNTYDGCYERPEYSILKFYVRGSTHNCFWTGHIDVYKEIFTPEDPQQKSNNLQLRRFIKQNKIQLPKVALFSNHSYFSRLRAGKWFIVSYIIDPEILGAPKNKFITEDTSEYHRNNIENFPEHKKIMRKWISISAKRHLEFENSINAIERHRLKLNDLSPIKSADFRNQSDDIIKQLKSLSELYKDGVLSKDEFDKAKRKLLN